MKMWNVQREELHGVFWSCSVCIQWFHCICDCTFTWSGLFGNADRIDSFHCCYCYLFRALTAPDAPRNGYATLLIVLLFLGGVIITILGMIGEYMARIYMEVKRRPLFIIKETNTTQDAARI